MKAEASCFVDAPAQAIYDLLADYRDGHGRILPIRYFPKLEVLEGGKGHGTVVKTTTRVLGTSRDFRMRVSEDEPGRVLSEHDLDSDLVTRFVIDPADPNLSRVTIATTWTRRDGVAGWIEAQLMRLLMQGMYRAELAQLMRLFPVN